MATMAPCPRCGKKGWHQPRLQMVAEGMTMLRCRYCHLVRTVPEDEALHEFLYPMGPGGVPR